jgi:hypothetical protein
VIDSAKPDQVGLVIVDLKNRQAPMTVTFRCVESARMVWNNTERDAAFALRLRCSIGGNSSSIPDLEWVVASPDGANAIAEFSQIKCQCGQGFKQGTGAKRAECVACIDGTYAPLNTRAERAECRACPREGVDCNGGVLVIYDDFWCVSVPA